MDDILKQKIGLTYGMINEKNNQMITDDKDKDKVIMGNANMLMG